MKEQGTEKEAFDKIEVTTIEGKKITMKEFENRVLLIVNTASACGFTPQYAELEELYLKHKDHGLVVLGFPCNQFGKQEPEAEDKIKIFCVEKYDVTFPLFSKIDVNGDQTHPLYVFLKKQSKGILGTEGIKWNFTKFLVNKNRTHIKRFAPQTKPQSKELVDEVVEALSE
jgi:glutathione peroxidase